MEKEFVSYKRAVALKELGFVEDCMGWYGTIGVFFEGNMTIHQGYLLAPLKQQVFKFFREKYNLHCIINITLTSKWYFELYNLKEKRNSEIVLNEQYFNSPEEAENACIDKLIELAKQQS